MVQLSWSSDCKCLLSVRSQLNAVCFSLKLIDFPELSVIPEISSSAAQFSVYTQLRSFWCEACGAKSAYCSHFLQARRAACLHCKISSHCFALKGSPSVAVTMCKSQNKGQGVGGSWIRWHCLQKGNTPKHSGWFSNELEKRQRGLILNYLSSTMCH